MTVDGNGIVDAPITLFVSEMECITCQTPPSNTDATVSSVYFSERLSWAKVPETLEWAIFMNIFV